MKKYIGIQLYSVRDENKARGFAAVLKDVAAAGFNCVEFAGFYDHTPEQVVALLKENGLTGISAHIGLDNIENSLPYIDAIGIKYVYIPGIPYDNLCGDKFAETVEKIKHVKTLLDKRGIVFGYHNHHREYPDANTDKVADMIAAVDGFTSELDIFWAKAAGRTPTDLMKKYGDRLSALHIKEMDKRTTDNPLAFPQAVPGEGISGCEEAFALGEKLGVALYVLEVEIFPGPVNEYLAASAAAMNRMAR